MSKNVKSALIVAGAILIIAVICGVIYSNSDKSANKNKGDANTTTTVEAGTTKPKKSGTTSTPVQTQPKVSGGLTPISEDSLPTPQLSEAVAIVQGKSIQLDGNELYYSLDLLVGTDNLQLSYIVGADGYNGVSVGDKVTVKLATYKNDNGAVFYMINGVQLL